MSLSLAIMSRCLFLKSSLLQCHILSDDNCFTLYTFHIDLIVFARTLSADITCIIILTSSFFFRLCWASLLNQSLAKETSTITQSPLSMFGSYIKYDGNFVFLEQ